MNLTKTDRRVLLGYLKNPDADPRDLADALDMSYWSLMKSKKKLLEERIMRFIWVPCFRAIGAEIIFSGYGSVKMEERTPEVSSDTLFFTALEERKGFGIGISSDYTELYEELILFSEKYGSLKAENFGITMLPVGLSDFWRLADFYPLISQDFGMGEIPKISEEPTSHIGMLKDSEKEIYATIIEHPDWTGEKIGNYLGTTRQRVLRLRERFEEAGLYRKKVVVDLKKLGYELLLFVSWTMKPGIYRKMYENISRYPLSPIILGISTPMQGIALAAFRSFRKSREIIERLSSWANPDENLIGEPEVLFLSVQDTTFPRYFDFSHSVRRILKIK